MKKNTSERQRFLGRVSSYVYQHTSKETKDVQKVIKSYIEENPDDLLLYIQNTNKVLKRCNGAFRDKKENLVGLKGYR